MVSMMTEPDYMLMVVLWLFHQTKIISGQHLYVVPMDSLDMNCHMDYKQHRYVSLLIQIQMIDQNHR